MARMVARRHPGIVPVDAARLRAALHRLRLRAGPSADAAAVRAGHRPAARGRGGAGSRAGAGARRGAAAVPHGRVPRGGQALLGRSVRVLRRRGSARAATTRRSPGMHEAAAAVAGGSLRAVEAILRGDVEHAHHPGGGLHHAMRGAGVRVLHLRRPGAGDRPGAAGRAAGAVHRPRRASRRRRPGASMGRPGRADVLDPRDRSGPVPGHRRCRRGRGGRRRRDGVNVPLPAGDRGAGVGGHRWRRCSPSWPPRSGRT